MNNSFTYKKKVRASTENLSRIRAFVSEHAEKHGFSPNQIADVRLAVDEACTNIIKHAYKNDTNKEISIEIEVNDQRLKITIVDMGESFDVKSYHKPNLKKQIQEKKRGGLGVHLMLNLMDDVTYQVKNKMNVLSMCKNRN
ncbi:MAG: ATP-binding protein [Balneolaceae bacterium]